MILPGQEPAAYLRHAQEELRHLHLHGVGGQELARRRADLIDLVLISLFRQAEHQASAGGGFREVGVAVVAVGGYGRRELCPYSDVDLMLLYRPEDSGLVGDIAERLFYPLWDAGLELGHGARTIEECVAISAHSLEIETSLLQSRLLVGDQLLFADLLRHFSEAMTADGGQGFVDRLAEARSVRHNAYGPTDALLEPHLKEGRGALRDVHEVLWLASALRGATGLDGLVSVGWLTPDTALELGGAVDRLLRARASLHYAVGRRVDRLYLDYQPDAAALYHPLIVGPDLVAASAGGGAKVEAVMTEVWNAAEAIATITQEIWAEVAPSRVRSAVVRGSLETAEERRGLLLDLLRRGREGAPSLEWLSHRGSLSAWIPGWESVRHLGQMDSLHTYTVGGHALRCAAAAVDMAEARDLLDRGAQGVDVADDDEAASGPEPLDSLGVSLASAQCDGPLWDALLLACMLHDIGKGTEAADHAEAGAALAARAAAGLGEPVEVQDALRFLVGEHLLLAATAVRRDLEDPALVARLADTIQTRDRLELLYVLTVADSMATGPAVWTPWTAALARELFFRVLHVMEEGRTTTAGATTSDTVGSDSVAAPPGSAAAATDAGEPARSMRVALGPTGGALTLEVRPSALAGIEELVVVSPARPGVLARVSGVLACHGITILSAQVQPEEAGSVSRVFRVADQFEGEVPEERWDLVERDLARVFAGRLSLDYRLAGRRARYAVSMPSERQEPARVVVENAVSEAYTVIEVHAADQIGLLHTLARSLDDLLLEVKVAKVATQRNRVVDVFYVTDAWGEKLLEPAHLLEVERALLFALETGA